MYDLPVEYYLWPYHFPLPLIFLFPLDEEIMKDYQKNMSIKDTMKWFQMSPIIINLCILIFLVVNVEANINITAVC